MGLREPSAIHESSFRRRTFVSFGESAREGVRLRAEEILALRTSVRIARERLDRGPSRAIIGACGDVLPRFLERTQGGVHEGNVLIPQGVRAF